MTGNINCPSDILFQHVNVPLILAVAGVVISAASGLGGLRHGTLND